MSKKRMENGAFIYEGINDAIQFVIDYLENSDVQYVGILGFSQGASLATLVYAQLNYDQKINYLPKFLLLFCGDQFGWAEDSSVVHLFEKKLQVNCVHVIGEEDEHRPGSLNLLSLFHESALKVLHHSGNHRPFPKEVEERDQLVQTIKQFVENHL
eukprot:TRINITY_DN42134_c0_g1_i1.p1 TRINITY_DN42134_c0_g1~~TRINITY_DN42134_c0_g1_i1.p1  ORF type:complete len:183 (+),score=22.95 TRINITY_DN42134_c0_g1_i1:84-551(+)